jgi:hypothetical protein
LANLPRSTLGGSKSASDKDDSTAPAKGGGKSFIPGKRDDIMET